MITGKRDTHEDDRYAEVMMLLENSTFNDEQRGSIMSKFERGEDVEAIIQNLLLNQLDGFDSGHLRLKDINRRMDYHECD